MAFQRTPKENEEPFYNDSDSCEDSNLPSVQISNSTILITESEKDLGTGGYRSARFKHNKEKYKSSSSLLHEDRSTSFSTTASVEFDSEENISNKPEELFWLRHPRVRENYKTVAAAFLLFFGGFVFLIAGIALSGLTDDEENSHKAIIFFVCAGICIIPGGYHIIYIYRATRGERGYNFESIPSFK